MFNYGFEKALRLNEAEGVPDGTREYCTAESKRRIRRRISCGIRSCIAGRYGGAEARIPFVQSTKRDSNGAGSAKKATPRMRGKVPDGTREYCTAENKRRIRRRISGGVLGCIAGRYGGAGTRIPFVQSTKRDSNGAGSAKKHIPHLRYVLFWCSCGNSNPGHLD